MELPRLSHFLCKGPGSQANHIGTTSSFWLFGFGGGGFFASDLCGETLEHLTTPDSLDRGHLTLDDLCSGVSPESSN